MGRDIDTTKHLIELIKTTVGKIVGKTTGREFKFINEPRESDKRRYLYTVL